MQAAPVTHQANDPGCGPAEGGGINLPLQLWQDKKVLVKSDTVMIRFCLQPPCKLKSQKPIWIFPSLLSALEQQLRIPSGTPFPAIKYFFEAF